MLGLATALTIAALPTGLPIQEVVAREAFLMGTTLRVEVAALNRAEGVAAIQAVFDTVAALDQVLSTWRNDSEISRLNRAAPGDTIPLSPTLGSLLEEAARWSAETGDAFDPAIGALVDAWDLRGRGRIPTAEALAAARRATGLGGFAFAPGGTAASRSSSAAWLDTGGFGKGAALRAAVAQLRHTGITAAALNFGGQVLVLGPGSDGGAWPVPIAHPARRGEPIALLRVRDASVSTSAQSERFVEVGGRHLGHILDPRTGRPVAPWGSVTVVAADAAEADMLSTALFVLGPTAGFAWAQRHPDVAAVFLICRGKRLEMRATRAVRPLLASTIRSLTEAKC